jgi:hypothetical protein
MQHCARTNAQDKHSGSSVTNTHALETDATEDQLFGSADATKESVASLNSTVDAVKSAVAQEKADADVQDTASIQQYLAAAWERVKIPGDGNCLFSAIATQLTQVTPMSLRQACANAIPTMASNILGTDWFRIVLADRAELGDADVSSFIEAVRTGVC